MSTNNESKYPIHITIGTTDYKVHLLTMTATEIKKLAVLDTHEYELYLEVDGHENTTMIPDDGPAVPLVDDMTFFLVHRQNPTVSIIIDAKEYTAPKHIMTGAEIKSLANIPVEYTLFLVPTARADEHIFDDHVVYLIKDEQFVSMKSNINNGNTLVSAAAVLPQREISYLEAQGFQYDLYRNPSNESELFLILKNYNLGENYTPQAVNLLVKIPQGFPNAEMDMFWVQPSVAKKDGQLPATVCDESYLGGTWQRFSRHRDANTWNPIMGGLRAHFTFISEALRKGE